MIVPRGKAAGRIVLLLTVSPACVPPLTLLIDDDDGIRSDVDKQRVHKFIIFQFTLPFRRL